MVDNESCKMPLVDSDDAEAARLSRLTPGTTVLFSEEIRADDNVVFSEKEEAVIREIVEDEEVETGFYYNVYSDKQEQVVRVPPGLVEHIETLTAASQPPASKPEVSGGDIDIKEGQWVIITRIVKGKVGLLFNQGDLLQIKKIGGYESHPEACYTICSPLDGKEYRLKRSAFEPVEEPIEVAEEPSSVRPEFCLQCGALLGPTAGFCNQCGAIISGEAKQLCSSCGAEIDHGVSFCKKCGAPQVVQAGPQSATQSRPRVPMVTPAVPTSSLGMICPNCGNMNVGGGDRPSWVVVVIILVSIFLFPIGLLSLLLLGVKDPYFCIDCGFSWKASSF